MSLLNTLPELQPDSGKHLSDSVITGMTRSLSRARYQLVRSRHVSGSGYIYEPTNGSSSLMNNLQASRKLMTLSAGHEGNFTYALNTALLGGTQYPVLTAVLGTAVGLASGGAGLLFTVATTGLDLARTTQRVLARDGDELWQVEAIGKIRSNGIFGSSTTALHVGSYFLVDPHRTRLQERTKGWLIHEQRTELTLGH